MIYLLIFILLFFLYNGLDYCFFGAKLGILEKVAANLPADRLPRISIVITACNEEKTISSALQSVCHLDYPNKEIIVVNDRSTDKTGNIINQLAANNPEIKTIHVESLPASWMGKNHALYVGAKQANGDWLLFTDADVHFYPESLLAAMSYVEEHNIDHLAVLPKVNKGTFWFNQMMLLVTALYYLLAKPWRAKLKWSKRSTGQGSFNLIRKTTYEKIGGHEKLRLNSDDDVKLGQLVKQHKFKQDFLISHQYVSVSWYHSLVEMAHGLEKNIFAYFNYSLLFMVFFAIYTLALFYLPLVGIFVFSGAAFILSLICVIVTVAFFMLISFQYRYSFYSALFYPITLLLNTIISWRGVWLIINNKGIFWRGTFYPLSDIKKHHIKTIF